jgi:hypothetical protein
MNIVNIIPSIHDLKEWQGELQPIGQNKVESLMRQAATHNRDAVADPIVKGLCIWMQKLLIINEKDCFKVKPKGCMEEKDWREINDILRVQGFNWLANGKDSCWIRMIEKQTLS